jgi:hypothetical protein
MGGACFTHGKKELHLGEGGPERKNHLEDIGIKGKDVYLKEI